MAGVQMRLPGCVLVIVALFSLPVALRAQQPEDRTQYGKDIVIETGQAVDDALCYFCSIRVREKLTGDALAIGGGIEVLGTIEGDAMASGGGIHLGPGATIGGDAIAVGGPVERGAQSSVKGEVSTTPWFHLPGQRQLFLRGVLAIVAFNLLSIVLCYLSLRRRRLEVITDSLRERLGLVILTGACLFLAGILLLVAADYLERIAAVLATLVPLILLVIFCVGFSGVSYGLGRRLAGRRNPLVAALLAAMLITLLELVPILGFLTFAVLGLLALGSAVLSGFGTTTDWLPKLFSRRQAPSSPVSPGG